MPPLGTAPRRVRPGVWETRSGRLLTAAGSAYWEKRYEQRLTDGQGHVTKAGVSAGAPVKDEPKRGGKVSAAVGAKSGKRGEPRKVPLWEVPVTYQGEGWHPLRRIDQLAEGVGQAVKQSLGLDNRGPRREGGGGVLGSPVPGVSPQKVRAYGKAARTVSDLALGPNITAALGDGKYSTGGLALDLALVPFLRPGSSALRAGREAAEAGARTVTHGDLVQQIPSRSKNRITRKVLDDTADAISQRFPNVPGAGSRSRTYRHAGREQGEEIRRGRVAHNSDIRALPKRDSVEDVAHFWWVQLPPRLRNIEGLRAVKDRLEADLADVLSRPSPRGDVAKAGRPQEAVDLAEAIAKIDRTIAANPKLDPRVVKAVERLSGARKDTLVNVGVLDPEQAAQREMLVMRWVTGAKHVPETPGRVGTPSASLRSKRARVEGLQKRYDRALERSRVENVMDDVYGPENFDRNLYDPTVMKLGAALSVAKDELAAAEKAAASRVRQTGVVGGDAEEGGIFVGHREDTPKGTFGIRTRGTGKATKPEGVGQENKMQRLSSGRVRMSTHVAAEDWSASRTYEDTIRARDTLWKTGDPVPHVKGEVSGYMDGWSIINPEGAPVPRGWKTDMLAKDEGEELKDAAREVLRTFIGGDKASWEAVVEEAKRTGVADKLRIVRDKDVDRFYRQFLPLGKPTKGGKVYDSLVDGMAASLIFGRIGYIPKAVAQNLIVSVPHQGPRLLMNAPRAGSLIPHPGQSELDRQLWDLLASEVGGGVAGSISKESATRVVGKPAHWVTSVGDTPMRISALLHELANKSVIPKWSVHLSDEDKARLIHVLTDKKERTKLNEASQFARDAMGDFDRMDPTQRRWARRFLIVPGWLWAGTRYPAKIATSYPGRTAAIGYVAAGEPGAPDGVPRNRPFWEYLAEGLPPWDEGVEVGNGRVERIGSLMPSSLPADIMFALARGKPLTAADYANPLFIGAVFAAASAVNGPNGPYRTSYLEALQRFAERLAPNVKFTRDMINPPDNPPYYPQDTSRWGRIQRELGVVPIKINRGSKKKPKKSAKTDPWSGWGKESGSGSSDPWAGWGK